MKMMVFAFAFLMVWMASGAWAACTSPAGNEGEQVYASTQKTMAYCNGTDWMSMGSSTAGGSVSGNIAVSNISVTTNVSVSGVTTMGWERINASSASLPVTANCSAGKQVIGGGCNGPGYCTDNVSWIGPTYGYPSSATAFSCVCYASGVITAGSVNAYAICARMN